MELSDSTDFRRDYYRENGFVKLDKVITADEIHGLERAVTDAVMQLHDPNVDKLPNSDSDAYEQAFTPWHCDQYCWPPDGTIDLGSQRNDIADILERRSI